MRTTGKLLYKSDYWIIVAFSIAIVLTYFLLHDIYRPNNYDDPGFLSFVYNYFNRGIAHDVVFGSTHQDGYSGLVLFGKTCGYLYGSVLSLVGWTRSNSHLISIVLVSLSAFLWYRIIFELKFSLRFALFFPLALLLLEPSFGAANQARSDALCFFLLSLSLLLFIKRAYLLSGFLAMVSFEVHPVGVSTLFYILAVTLARRGTMKTFAKNPARSVFAFACGLLLGAGYYYILHRNALPLLFTTLARGNKGGFEIIPILTEYFFKTKYYRHIPELILIIGCAGVFIARRYWRKNRLPAFFLLAACAIALVIRRPNFMYMIFLYPAFLLVIFYVFQSAGRLRLIMVMLLIYLIPQYAYVYFQNRDFNFQCYVEKVARVVPDDGLSVIGSPNNWFAFQDRDFYTLDYRKGIESLDLQEFYLIENDAYRNGKYGEARSIIRENYISREIGQFEDRGRAIVVKKAIRPREDRL
jgi:hypothetical protein